MAMFRTEYFRTPIGRVSFAQNLFKARKQGDGPTAKEKFGATLIFPKTMMREKACRRIIINDKTGERQTIPLSFEDVIAEAIVGEWGEKGLARAKSGLIKSPFLPGDGKEARNKETGELHPGMGADFFFIRVQANADRAPKVSSSSTTFLPATEDEVYSGCYGFAVLNAFTWHNDQNGDGVSLGINMFFKTGDGDRLGGSGGGDPDKWTESVPDAGEAPASTKSGAGAGGLFGD